MHPAYHRPSLQRQYTPSLQTETAPSLASTPLQFPLFGQNRKGSRSPMLVISGAASCSLQDLNASRQLRGCHPEDSSSMVSPARGFGESCMALPAPAARLVKKRCTSQPCSPRQHPKGKGRQIQTDELQQRYSWEWNKQLQPAMSSLSPDLSGVNDKESPSLQGLEVAHLASSSP